jgi:hypothetical protein
MAIEDTFIEDTNQTNQFSVKFMMLWKRLVENHIFLIAETNFWLIFHSTILEQALVAVSFKKLSIKLREQILTATN